ncbi:hypothetical protein AB2S62_01175 [Vibrio sp. NTOU-M3]|uniref:capsular polysaccharide export protein, LipB/KpsS family n=1 Tax=Vibrio sp. NTOU-M3 TaxID=3234954 RepID=UPI00349F6DC0
MLITFITPYNCESKDSYLYERAKYFLHNSYLSDKTRRIFVDFASLPSISDELEEIAKNRGIEYIRLEKYGEQFSIGTCRNIGVLDAKTKYISFQDVDLYAIDSVYEKIEERVENYTYFNELELIPCLYLTREHSLEYLDNDESTRYQITKNAYLENDKSRIEMYAPASSCQLIERSFYLMSGGVRKDFYGHGYEDFELHYRLCAMSNKFYRTHNPRSHDYKYDSLEYKGYRTLFSMFGRPLMDDGIFFVHLWHDNHKGTKYQKRNAVNKKIFEHSMVEFDEKKFREPILADNRHQTKLLVLAQQKSLNASSLRHLFSEIGQCVFVDEKSFKSFSAMKSYIQKHGIDRVFFFNPYGNDHRLNLYRECRKNKIPFYVYDRGGLNDSWFIDPNGFNADSDTYHEKHWNHPLTLEQDENVRVYINDVFLKEETLEKNGERIGGEFFRYKYGVNNKKILFVPYQRPGDSVIRHFSGNVKGVEDFSAKLQIIAEKLSQDWVVVAKKHPLETEINMPDNVIYLRDDKHIFDCIQGCDAVLLINSGVGLLSMMAGKPVYHFGQSYYTHPEITQEVTSADDAVKKISKGFTVNLEKVKRFIHYLTNEAYSFATTDYQEVKEGNASRNVAVFSKFYQINIPNELSLEYKWREMPFPVNTRYYDFYRSYFAKPKEPAKKAAPLPKPKPSASQLPASLKPDEIVLDHVAEGDRVSNKIVGTHKPKQKKYGVKHKLGKLIRDPVGVFRRKLSAKSKN